MILPLIPLASSDLLFIVLSFLYCISFFFHACFDLWPLIIKFAQPLTQPNSILFGVNVETLLPISVEIRLKIISQICHCFD